MVVGIVLMRKGEPMDDLISRQEVLDWLKNEWNGMVTSLFDGIKALPPAHQEKRTQERTETHACDCISREAAIVQVNKVIWDDAVAHDVKEVLKELPAAQPELIEKVAYIRGFEQGRTQGMIDAQGHGRGMTDERIKYI